MRTVIAAELRDSWSAWLGVCLGRQCGDRVRAVRGRQPLDHRRVRVADRPAHHADVVGHHERGQQPDAELAEEVAAGQLEVAALGAAADRREQFVHVTLGEADTRVLHAEFAAARADPDRAGRLRIEGEAGGDGVHRVLQQLAQVHPGAGVEVLGEQIDQAAEIDVKGVLGVEVRQLGHGPAMLPTTPDH